MFGGYRSSAQAISYEVIMVLSFLLVCFAIKSLNMKFVFKYVGITTFFLLFIGVFLLGFILFS